MLNFIRNCEVKKDKVELGKKLISATTKQIKVCESNVNNWYDIYKETLLALARYDLDSFMLYLEFDRPAKEKFYAPRRKKIKHIVNALQKLSDGELEELFISQPPRTGKTTIVMFYLLQQMCNNPEKSNLYCAFSETITGAFYKGILEIIDDEMTYKLRDIYPELQIKGKNSQLHTLNIGREKRYPTLTSRSLYGTLNGSCDCTGLLIADDLIGGIEEALNRDRMMGAWLKTTNNMLSRAKFDQGCRVLWIGTRWSIIDPIGLRISTLQSDPNFKDKKYEIINLPALNEQDESNFDYDYGVGFSTQTYKEIRATFEKNGDAPSFLAQYQGVPIEREGTLFSSDDLRYFNGELPLEKPDLVYMAVDPAFGGGDFVASPICYKYGEEVYVVDVVYTNEDKTFSQPDIVMKAIKYEVSRIQIEANKSTKSYAEEVNRLLRDKGHRVNVMTKSANNQSSKEQRIFDKAPEIKEHFIFLDSGYRSKEYNLFMQNVLSFTITGKNKHDDAPDSLAMACDMAFHYGGVATAIRRPF